MPAAYRLLSPLRNANHLLLYKESNFRSISGRNGKYLFIIKINDLIVEVMNNNSYFIMIDIQIIFRRDNSAFILLRWSLSPCRFIFKVNLQS